MLSFVLFKPRNAPIPTMKIRQIQYLTGFMNSTLWKIKCNWNPKTQAVNKAQQQLRPESYFPESFKSQALVIISPVIAGSSIYADLNGFKT